MAVVLALGCVNAFAAWETVLEAVATDTASPSFTQTIQIQEEGDYYRVRVVPSGNTNRVGSVNVYSYPGTTTVFSEHPITVGGGTLISSSFLKAGLTHFTWAAAAEGNSQAFWIDSDDLTLPGSETYGTTFRLPANTGTRAILYIATQNLGGGVVISVGSHTQLPGAAAYDFYVGNLTHNLPVDLQQVTGGFVSNYGGVASLVMPGNPFNTPPTKYVTVLTVPSSIETSPGSGATAADTLVAQPTVAAPPSGGFGPVAAPTHAEQGSPTGSGGASKEDVERIGNQIATAVNAAHTGNVEALNEVIKGLGAVDASIRDQTEVVRNNRKETAEEAAARTAAVSAAASAGASAASAAASQYGTAAGGSHTGLGYTVGSGTAPNLAVTMPAAFGGATFDLNPFTSERLGPVASWFRSAIAWLTIITLGAWVWNEIDIKTYQAGQARQAVGNAVAGGTGGQITALTAAAALTTATVTLATALLSWSFGEISFPAFLTALGTNPTSTMASGALWMCDQILPVSTIITACVARLTWKLYSVPLFASCQVICRFIVP